jgi:hypothetical protein
MDLRDFVAQTLSQIAGGVKDAQALAGDVGAIVNPRLTTSHEQASKQGLLSADDMFVPIVQFDVAVTVIESSGTKGGIGVFAGAINLGSVGQSQAENSSVSRIKFSVPLALPNNPE